MSDLPTINVIRAFAISSESMESEELCYPNLAEAANNARLILSQQNLISADNAFDALGRLLSQEQILKARLILKAEELIAESSQAKQRTLAVEFTGLSSEIYGTPVKNLAIDLLDQMVPRSMSNVFKSLKDYFYTEYGSLFHSIETEIRDKQVIDVFGLADIFNLALSWLRSHEDGWDSWRIVLEKNRAIISVNASKRDIIIGYQRPSIAVEDVLPLVAHEILIHARRSVMGFQNHAILGETMPGAVAAEEGLGICAEYAISGKLPQKIIDRYTDIALAMGYLDGRQRTRKELFNIVYTRELARLGSVGDHREVKKRAFVHVNRIYRGTQGSQAPGFFTKDIAYYDGFVKISKYIHERLQQGSRLPEIMQYLMLGKFDPMNSIHVDFVSQYASDATGSVRSYD